MSTDVWAMEKGFDMASIDVLGTAPTLDESSVITTQTSKALPLSPLGLGRASGLSTESGLGQGAYDSEQELEAIRGSVRSLRAQREAVEQLKEKARNEEISAGMLRRKLRDAEAKIKELKTQGGRDLVRRLMGEVTELRAQLKATSSAFQMREKSLQDLREAVRTQEDRRRAVEAKARTQERKIEEQDRSSREQQATIRCLKEACARCEERASSAEKRLEQKFAESGRELASLSAQLKEANAALDASKRNTEGTLEEHTRMLEAVRKENESLLFEKGRAQERINELTAICERQRSSFAESGRRTKDLERIASAAKQEAKLADKQISELKVKLSESSRRRRDEEADAAQKLRAATTQVSRLRLELAEGKAEAAEKERLLAEHRSKMLSYREDVTKLRAVVARQDEMRHTLARKEETIQEMRQRLELERRERGQWGRARKELLSQFCEEENKLRSTLQTVSHQHGHRPSDGVPPPAVGNCYHYESDTLSPRKHHNDNQSTSSKKVSSRGKEEPTSPCDEASDEEEKYASSSTHRTTSQSTEKSDSDGGTQRERRKPVRA